MGEKKKPNGCAIGCMVAVAVFLVLFIAGMVYGCNANQNPDPNAQVEDELQMLDKYHNEIMTQIGNLNVTGYGDFVNQMNEDIDFCNASVQQLNDKFGDEYPRINLCKDAWTKLAAICIASRDAIQNGDTETAATVQLFEQEYQDLINQIENYQDS